MTNPTPTTRSPQPSNISTCIHNDSISLQLHDQPLAAKGHALLNVAAHPLSAHTQTS